MKTSIVGLFNPDLTRSYGVVVLNEWKADLIPALKAANPDVKVLLYKNAAFLREDDNASTVGGFATAPYSWFLRDAAGNRITRQVYDVTAYMMDPGMIGWKWHWQDLAGADAARLGFDGVFADDCYACMYGEIGDADGYTDDTYQAAVRGFLASAKANMPDLFLVANLVEHLWYPDLWADWLTVVDGLMDEHFMHVGMDPRTGFKTADDWWDRQVREVEECERQGKLGLFVSRGLPTDLKTMNYCWASYLLGAGEHTHFAHYGERYEDAPWWEEWGHDFGESTSTRLELEFPSGPSEWWRGYTLGWAAVDPRKDVISGVIEMAGSKPEPPVDPRPALLEAEHAAVMEPYKRVSGQRYRQVDSVWLARVLAAGTAVEG